MDDISSKAPRGTPNEGGWTHAAMRPIAWWTNVTAKHQPIMLIVTAWAVLVLPLVFLRGFNSDDGVAVTLRGPPSRRRLAHATHVQHTVCRAADAAVMDHRGDQPAVRHSDTGHGPIADLLSVLGGALLIFGFLKPRVSLPAAVFGACCFSPVRWCCDIM